jgi:hypothetical protein
MKANFRFFLFLICFSTYLPFLASQDLIEINITQKCIFSGNIMDEELYKFPVNEDVKSWIKDILFKGGAEQNFEIVQTNVENVTAVISNNRRYILYSLDFIQKASSLEAYGSLAHEIGHHVNNHILTDEHRIKEELEADQFMGYVLSKLMKGEPNFDVFIKKMPSSYAVINHEERIKAINEGTKKAKNALLIKESLPYAEDNKTYNLTLPTFPWPPPQCNSQFELPIESFAGAATLRDIDKNIRRVLDNKGYTQRAYFSVPNGFAIVTQLEQYNGVDGTCRYDKTRWFDYPSREKFDGMMSYIKSFFFPNKGYFRLFAFIATNQPFNSTGKRVTKEEATAWLNLGFNKLPNDIANMPVTEGYNVTCLIYEFEVPESNRRPNQVCPSPRFNAQTHLVRAGILSN